MGVVRNVVNADLLRGRRREVWLRGGKAMGSEGEGRDTSQESGCHRALGKAGSRDPPVEAPAGTRPADASTVAR